MLGRQQAPRTKKATIIYNIPCASYKASYIGETGRELKTRLQTHHRYFTHQATSNALVRNALSTEHLPNWEEPRTLHETREKSHRKVLEAAFIKTSAQRLVNTSPGFFVLTSAPDKLSMNVPQYQSAS